jgi:enamine deaminase RidA (YjgF/YER057c/UK114 family)
MTLVCHARAARALLEFEMPVTLRSLTVTLLTFFLAGNLCAQKKDKKDIEPKTQVLAPLPEPPDAVVAETARLSFQVSPLSNKGLLTPQIREALKALLRDNHGAQIVKLRAFVAGSGDLRRVQTIVAEEFTDRKLAMPAISTIQVGALPMVGAQVVIEATSVEKRAVNPEGLAFYPGYADKDVAQAVSALRGRASSGEIVRATCFISSIDDAPKLQAAAAMAFPGASVNVVQAQRLSLAQFVSCEGIARVKGGSVNLPGMVSAGRIVMTGTKLVFRDQDSDIRLTYQRLGKAMEPLGASFKDVFWTGIYPLTLPVANRIDSLQKEFAGRFDAGNLAQVLFEGLPSTDATAAIELMAAVP